MKTNHAKLRVILTVTGAKCNEEATFKSNLPSGHCTHTATTQTQHTHKK